MVDSSSLHCVVCGSPVTPDNSLWTAPGLRTEWPSLMCAGCGRRYPVCSGVPVMFVEEASVRRVVDAERVSSTVNELSSRMAEASELAGDDLNALRQGDPHEDSLTWEFYFWEHWKQQDEGVVCFDLDKIDRFLEQDREGGGRLAFLERVEKYAGGIDGKIMLNVGAGRDLLLERVLQRGCAVVEVDVVLEPLVRLRERGAHLCVCCDARRLPFSSGAFDCCTSFGSLHHIWPIEGALSEMMRTTNGHVHLNEPNSLALTRLALHLPPALRSRLKRWYSEGHSRSPYEAPIHPKAVRRAVRESGGRVVSLTFPRSSWVSESAAGLRKLVRYVNMAAVAMLPVTSSHFDAVIRSSSVASSN